MSNMPYDDRDKPKKDDLSMSVYWDDEICAYLLLSGKVGFFKMVFSDGCKSPLLRISSSPSPSASYVVTNTKLILFLKYAVYEILEPLIGLSTPSNALLKQYGPYYARIIFYSCIYNDFLWCCGVSIPPLDIA